MLSSGKADNHIRKRSRMIVSRREDLNDESEK